LKVKRQFFQVYTEFERGLFDGKEKTEHTLLAGILQTLAPNGFREVILSKNFHGIREHVVRVKVPEAEIKYGITCNNLYVQVSVSDKNALEKLNDKVLAFFQEFFKTDDVEQEE